MKNSNALEKSKGFLVFAFDTDVISYVDIADKTSSLIKKFTNLPVTLVTDITSKTPLFDYDNIITVENTKQNTKMFNGTNYEWRNHGRSSAYDLSPYDTTILVDCDLLVLDDSLIKFADTVQDYRLVFDSRDRTGPIYSRMGTNSLPFVWATVVMFNKTNATKLYFELIKRIEQNYGYYKTLFSGTGTYRNDYAFAIADIILKGYYIDKHSGLPWNMFAVTEKINSIETKNNFITIKNETAATVIPRQPVHIMDKLYLQSDQFASLVKELINE